MDDLISRQAAIDALKQYSEMSAIYIIKDLPLAQNLQPTCNQLATDCISRQAAIDALDKHCDVVCQYSKKQRSVMCGACPLGTAFDVIESLPFAQPETDGFCDGCKEYDQERHFCPRFDRVIKKTVEEMQIIHCKDCKHSELFSDQYLCRKATCWREGDFYCGYAERREE